MSKISDVSRAAAILGRASRGVKKTITAQDSRARRDRLAAVRHLRWAGKKKA